MPAAHKTAGHPGIHRMKVMARSEVWWPHLDVDMKNTVQNYDAFQSVRALPAAAPLHCWKWSASVAENTCRFLGSRQRTYVGVG